MTVLSTVLKSNDQQTPTPAVEPAPKGVCKTRPDVSSLTTWRNSLEGGLNLGAECTVYSPTSCTSFSFPTPADTLSSGSTRQGSEITKGKNTATSASATKEVGNSGLGVSAITSATTGSTVSGSRGEGERSSSTPVSTSSKVCRQAGYICT